MSSAPTSTLAEQTASYLLDVRAKQEPYALLDELREKEPVHQSAAGTWIVSDYALCVSGLRDSRLSRSAAVAREVDIMLDDGEARTVYKSRIMNQDGPNHLRLRRLLTGTFSIPAVAAWRPAIERTVDELFDQVVPLRSGDFARLIAYPVPEHVVCSLLSVPFEDHAKYEHWASIINVRPQAGEVDDERRARTTEAWDEFINYLRVLVQQRRADPGDDLISQLVTVEIDGDHLSDTEAIAVLTEVINGGHDTTANTLINGVYMLLRHPDQLALLQADPSLAAAAADEVLRFRSPVQTTLIRRTTEDVELGGVTIPADSTVLFCLAAANRQPGTFDDPGHFDITRTANRHIGFGNGQHICLGQHLARVETEITLAGLAQRMPGLTLDVDPEQLTWRATTLVMAPLRLPVRW
jgi:cytochrome P450